jgi:hypothetical protein
MSRKAAVAIMIMNSQKTPAETGRWTRRQSPIARSGTLEIRTTPAETALDEEPPATRATHKTMHTSMLKASGGRRAVLGFRSSRLSESWTAPCG